MADRRKRDAEWIRREKGEVSPEDLARLARGEPVAYVIGWVPFLGCQIDLSERPLIPRPETEYWTEQAIEEIESGIKNKESAQPRVLDLFAGSGCIGIAVLKRIPGARVTFADKEEKAVRQIRKNLSLNRIPAARRRIVRSDVLRNVRGRFDYVLANPPYIPSGRKLAASVSEFEPKSALYGGVRGLKFLRRLARELPRVLAAGGKAYVEFDISQKRELEAIFRGFPSREFRRDQYGRWRYAVLGN